MAEAEAAQQRDLERAAGAETVATESADEEDTQAGEAGAESAGAIAEAAEAEADAARMHRLEDAEAAAVEDRGLEDAEADAAERRVATDDAGKSAVEEPTAARDTAAPVTAATEDIEETQVIPVQQPPQQRMTDTAIDLDPVDDRPHLIPGFDRYDDEATQVIHAGTDTDRTQVLPESAGPDAEDTQVIPSSPPPGGGRRLGRSRGSGRPRGRRRR